MIKALVFDLDDTLYLEKSFVLSGFRAVGGWLHENYGLSGFEEAAARLFYKGYRGNIFNQAFLELNFEYSYPLITIIVELYRNHSPEINLLEDAAWALRSLSKTYKLGLLTDGHLITQKNKVSVLGIEHYFKAIVYTDEFGREHWKPSTIPFNLLLNKLECSSCECVYVADNVVKDFFAPRQLGWKTIQVCREDGVYGAEVARDGYQADLKIATLYELESLLLTLRSE